MKKLTVLLAGAMLMVGITSGIAGAVTVTTGGALGNGGLTTSVSGATIETFNGGITQGWTWTGDYQVVNGSLGSSHAAPAYPTGSDVTDYISVPNPKGSGFVTATNLGGSYNYLGLWWGSIDAGNELKLLSGNTVVADIFGSSISVKPDGNWTSPNTNKYVNVDLGTTATFDSFVLSYNGIAFEADNIAVANTAPVPEPGTLALLGLGMAGLAIIGKRRQNNKA